MRKERLEKWLLVILLLTVMAGWTGWYFHYGKQWAEEKRNWQERIEKLLAESRKLVIIRRVSEQMEEVAYQQKDISDERRLEAVKQRQTAEEMRRLAEQETRKALEARADALRAFHEAEEQKKIADGQREEALEARKKADTLAGLALGRSLGTLAVSQFQAGNKELGELLGYYAWKNISDYKGDCYQPAVLGALSLVSGTSTIFFKHKGAIRDVAYLSEGRYVSVSGWGEVVMWENRQEEWNGKELLTEPGLDFRKVTWDQEKNILYILAYSGVLAELSGEGYKEVRYRDCGNGAACGIVVSETGPVILFRNGVVWDVTANHILYRYDRGITAVYSSGSSVWWAGGDGKIMSGLKGTDTLFQEDADITALAMDTSRRLCVAGCRDGRLLVWREGQEEIKVLPGHGAAVNGLAFQEKHWVSVGYDGKVNLWDMEDKKPVAVLVADYSDWIYCVVLNGVRVLCGGAMGALYIGSVSPDFMAGKLKEMLKRDFTEEERKYYLEGSKGE